MGIFPDLGEVSKAGKSCEKPAKGGFGNFGSPQIGGAFLKRGNEHMRTLNNTEWGGRACRPPILIPALYAAGKRIEIEQLIHILN